MKNVFGLLVVIFMIGLFSCTQSGKKTSDERLAGQQDSVISVSKNSLITYDSILYAIQEFKTSQPKHVYLDVTEGKTYTFCTNNTTRSPFLFTLITPDTTTLHARLAPGKCKVIRYKATATEKVQIVYHFKKKTGDFFWIDVENVQRDTIRECECPKGRERFTLRPGIQASAGSSGGVTTSVDEK